ncbi:ATP synthase F1 subunit delta [Roseofilum reptotaenium CS-1145]|uniref:ATP synthase subunit delta n=1 Tax=Roseofilum reptotaenium AO1-A TaxID=1925591 RepID=A0A1L9QRL0_9CYAN|nr:ATP synthase F1 subunit delta [Roseofilum reptotaenium]MDB9515460.1 ATP synthase F1 subunit delta [Roseofilum reptotaenium CS-1145]OJJ25335.1 F0F1 ATP synthase subunit delta [Roseofilum reptotaenium AO1-A]
MANSSMIGSIVEPYAQALMSIAQNHDLTDKFGDDVRLILEMWESSEQLRSFLGNPLVNPDAKKGVLRQITQEGTDAYVQRFLFLLVDRGRIQFLDGVCQTYLALLRKLNQTVLAQVTSAVELRDEERTAIAERTQAMTNARHVEIETRIDPDLIGGVIIQVGSQVIDASLRGQLRRIGLALA